MHDRWKKRLGVAAKRLLPLGVAVAVGLVVLFGYRAAGTEVRASQGGQTYLPFVAGLSPGPTPTPMPGSTPVSLNGASHFGAWAGTANASMISSMQSAGARWTRVSMSWSAIEPTLTNPPTYNFSAYDGELAGLAAAGIQPIMEIGDTPSWAASVSCGPLDQPGAMDAFAGFLQAAVQRYHGAPYDVENWEIYNEPDGINIQGAITHGTSCFGVNANWEAQYVALLQTAYTTIKQNDPSATVLLGGMGYDSPHDFNMNFLDDILSLSPSAGPYFDVANMHYFSSFGPIWASNGTDIIGKVNAIQAVMAKHGLSKPVAVTEISWTSTPFAGPVTTSSLPADLLAAQASYAPKVLARGLSRNLYAMIWFSAADWPGGDYPYGLVDLNGNPKPVDTTYKVAAAEFGSATSAQPLAASAVGVSGGVEGYVFTVYGRTRWVLWASPDGSSVSVVLPANATRAKDASGNAISLAGNGAPTTYQLTDSPIYVEF